MNSFASRRKLSETSERKRILMEEEKNRAREREKKKKKHDAHCEKSSNEIKKREQTSPVEYKHRTIRP